MGVEIMALISSDSHALRTSGRATPRHLRACHPSGRATDAATVATTPTANLENFKLCGLFAGFACHVWE